MKNLLKFISIGLVLMVVVFSQVTQQSAAVEAADASEDDIEFMDTADAVVKSYKASSTNTPVYLYVRDSVGSTLNTSHSGTTEWKAASAQDRLIDETSTMTLDDATLVVTTVVKDSKAATFNLTSGQGQDFGTADLNEKATITSGAGLGLTLDCVTAADPGNAVTSCSVGDVPGTGYKVGDTVTVEAANHAGASNLVVTIATDTAINSTVANYVKTEDSDQGVANGPNLFLGAETPVTGITSIKLGEATINTDALNES